MSKVPRLALFYHIIVRSKLSLVCTFRPTESGLPKMLVTEFLCTCVRAHFHTYTHTQTHTHTHAHLQIEGQRAALARADAERNAMSKVERIKMDQVCLIDGDIFPNSSFFFFYLCHVQSGAHQNGPGRSFYSYFTFSVVRQMSCPEWSASKWTSCVHVVVLQVLFLLFVPSLLELMLIRIFEHT